MRKKIIILLLFASWPIGLIHQAWSHLPVKYINPFPFYDYKYEQQWYVYDLCSILSYLCIFFAMVLYLPVKGSVYSINILIKTITIVQLIDLIHFLLWFSQMAWIVAVESVIYFLAMAMIFIYGYRKNK